MLTFLSVFLALQGTWQKPCSQQMIRKEIFQSTTASLVETNFSDSSCQLPQLETISEGSFSIGKKVLLTPSGEEMDFYFSRVQMRALSNEVLHWMRENSFCEISNWQLGIFQEITGKTCKFPAGKISVPKAGEQRFGIFRIEEDRLFFGDLNLEKNGKSPENRPNQWDEIPFKKVFQP
jgi:hypothetical protein